MKRTNKLIAALCLILCFLSLVLVCAGAESSEDNGDAYTDAATEEVDVSENAKEDNGGQNGFSEIWQTATEYSCEIASVFAAVCSVILAFTMSRGLTPMLKDAIGGMTRAVGKLGDGVSESEKHRNEITDALMKRIDLAEKTVDGLAKAVEALEERRAHDAEEEMMREDILTVMSAQVELLYDLFMSASLPKYSKDAVGERVALMRERLAHKEACDEA